MEFVKFSVVKYRSLIKKCEIDISRLTTIIGPNNEGKSNILRAIVTAVKILEIIGAEPNLQMKKGDKLSMITHVLRDDVFLWGRDYPLSAQRRKRDTGVTTFVLEFALGDAELQEIIALTGSLFSKKKVALKLEITEKEVSYSLNLKGIFNKRADKKKLVSLAQYFASRINICYIDAVRTSETAGESMAKLVDIQIKNQLYESEEYKRYLLETQKKKTELLNDISNEVSKVLREFLPGIKQTSVRLHERRFGNAQFWSTAEVEVNDGEKTSLELKGSGVQSLIALALARFVSQQDQKSDSCFVLAVEEPESHLHPDAIHRVRQILKTISANSPVIITTHSPLLVNIDSMAANILVNEHTAKPAKSKEEIRQLLGAHASDSLMMSECNLIVEGISDERLLRTILSTKSKLIKEALDSRILSIIVARGCSKMGPIVKVLKSAICKVHAVFDDDEDGRTSAGNLIKNDVLSEAEVTHLKFPGMASSEIEDALEPQYYWPIIAKQYGIVIDVTSQLNGTSRKWSERLKQIFVSQGKQWEVADEDVCKTIVASAVSDSAAPCNCIRTCRVGVFDALVAKIEALIKSSDI